MEQSARRSDLLQRHVVRETPRPELLYVARSHARVSGFILIFFALFNAERFVISWGSNRYFIFSRVQLHSFIVMRASVLLI